MNASVDRIVYQVKRSRRRTTAIIVGRDGSVLVRAPHFLSDARIADLVASKRHWIGRALADWRDLNAMRVVREYRNGDTFLYLGRTYPLLLVVDQQQPLLLKHGRFRLRRDVVEAGGTAAAQSAFREYYTHLGKLNIAARVADLALTVGAAPRRIDVREMGGHWASCSPRGDLAFHWKCMMAPGTVIDYIVVHELCHLHHHNHSRAFWNEVGRVVPDYRERKLWLRQNGGRFDL